MNEPFDRDDNVERELDAAGRRLRATAPDAATTRQALARVNAAATPAPAPRRRPAWTPFALVGGLAAAALIAIVVFASRSPTETIRQIPADSVPTTVAIVVPSTDAEPAPDATGVPVSAPPPTTADTTGEQAADSVPAPTTTVRVEIMTYEYRTDQCFRMSLDSTDRRLGSAGGCIPLDDVNGDHLYLTMIDDAIYRILEDESTLDASGRPLLYFELYPSWAVRSCGLFDEFPAAASTDLVIDLIACNRGDVRDVALAARIPNEEGAPPEYFTTAAVVVPGGRMLSGPVAVAGLPGAAAFSGEPFDGVRCVAVTQTERNRAWREQCWSVDADFPESDPAVTMIDGVVVQLELADEQQPTGSILDDRGLPYTGCGAADIETMIGAALDVRSGRTFTGMRCDELNGVLRSPSALLGNGGADGGFEVFGRTDRSAPWTYVDSGTGIEVGVLHDVLAASTWTDWPGDTVAYVSTRTDIDLSEFRGADEVAGAIVKLLDDEAAAESDGEFPTNAHVVAAALPGLVVVLADVGGDDSVAGTVHFVHFVDSEGGLEIVDWFYSAICARGGGGEFCI